jgi:serine/threonine protein kinase
MLPPGSIVGGYRLERRIDHGSFGEVYQARSLHGDTIVALKLISLTQEDEVISAERLGALLQQRFEKAHGMVPETFEPGQDEHYFYIPMEFVDAPALSTLIQVGPLEPLLAARHAASICEFLEKAHRFATVIDGVSYERIIHADLKPPHIFITGEDRITVLDFGIAKALEKNRLAKTVRFGTPHYMSPERLREGRTNEHDDMWALGVILYEMVSGHRPYAELEDPDSHATLRHAIETNAPREPLPSSCPRDLVAIIHKLLNHQVDRRYVNAAAIKEDLEAFLRHETPLALKEFATAETIKAPPAPGVGGQSPRLVPPTVPFPASAPDQDASRPDTPDAPTLVPSTVGRRTLLPRSAWAAMLLALTALFTTEGVAWVGAERMRAELGTLDRRGVVGKRQEYDRLRRWNLLHLGPRLRLDDPLKERLVSLADAVLLDYRQEEPTVAETQWRQAREALKWAADLAPNDASLLPKELDCEAHLNRIDAQSRMKTNASLARQTYKQAIERFLRAAALNPAAPDPYLGLSRIYIYGLDNVDEGAKAIHEAESRGYKPGRRERALLGDGYMRRAEKSRKQRVSGDERRRVMEGARDDYQRCIDFFDPIVGFGKASANLELCKRRRDAANRELDARTERP